MIEFLATLLTLLPFLGLWATIKFFRWWKHFGGRFLFGLALASAVSDVVAMPVAWIAARRLFLGPDAPPFPYSGEILGFSVIVLECVFLVLMLAWNGDLETAIELERKQKEEDA